MADNGKKRARKPTAKDTDAEKKLKAEENGGMSNGTSNGATSNGGTSSGGTSNGATSHGSSAAVVAPPPEAFMSPVATKKGGKKKSMTVETVEETPYMTARQANKPGGVKSPVKQTPSKLETKLEAVAAEKATTTTPSAPKIKIVRRGSFLCTTLLLFLWIASSAVLGGLWLKEKLEHRMNVFRLQQELLDQQVIDPPAVDETELQLKVKQLQKTAVEQDGKLSGYKKEYQDALTKLEQALGK